MQFRQRKPGTLDCLYFRDRAAIHCAEKVIQQALTCCRVIKNVPDEGCFRRFLDEVLQTLRSGIETLEEESIHRGVACWQLRGMQVPTLVERVHQRMLNVIV